MLTRHKRLRTYTNFLHQPTHTVLLAALIIAILPCCHTGRLYYTSDEYMQHDYHLDVTNKNRIETEQQCKHYLCKYGYLNCNCTSYLLPVPDRQKRAVPPIIPTELEVENSYQPDHYVTFPPMLTTPSNQQCHITHFKRAYEEFQIVYRLNVSGHCDGTTMMFMSRSRCGQPDLFDIEDMKNHDYQKQNRYGDSHSSSKDDSSSSSSESSSEENDKRRKKRSTSLTELLKPYACSIRKTQLDNLVIKEEKDNQETYNSGQSTRNKRSFNFVVTDPIGKLNKEVVTWRLMSAHTNPSIPVSVQNALLSQAFRYWSEVAPICFRQDKRSARVDIEIGFLEGTHLNCYKQFDGRGGEIAHKFYRDVHFDKNDPYTASMNPSRSTDISLLLVAVHEIGHVLGLNHSAVQESVMNAIYHRNIRGRFELSNHDRFEIKTMYGPCTGRFDIVMDYVRNSGSARVFNTYFFRGNSFWMYENKNRRTRYGDPKQITSNWNGLPANLDTYVHYFESDRNGRNRISEHYYFFKGSSYYKFDPVLEMVTQSGSIRMLFGRGQYQAIPNNLDAAFYEYNTKLIFFFKGDTVYKYDYGLSGFHSCCTERPRQIVDVFRPETPADRYAPGSHITYTSGLDSVYLSWTAPYTLYLIKGEHVWKVVGYNVNRAYNEANYGVRYVGKWNTLWHYICETDCPA